MVTGPPHQRKKCHCRCLFRLRDPRRPASAIRKVAVKGICKGEIVAVGEQKAMDSAVDKVGRKSQKQHEGRLIREGEGGHPEMKIGSSGFRATGSLTAFVQKKRQVFRGLR